MQRRRTLSEVTDFHMSTLSGRLTTRVKVSDSTTKEKSAKVCFMGVVRYTLNSVSQVSSTTFLNIGMSMAYRAWPTVDESADAPFHKARSIVVCQQHRPQRIRFTSESKLVGEDFRAIELQEDFHLQMLSS